MTSIADLDTEEVRVALAMNGGVSLAVWMGGCVAELDCARRAHLGPEQLESREGGAAPPPREIYHLLCAAFRRELVFDVMSGASAGGINGALLAAATIQKGRLHPDFMRDKWLDLGDFSKLLHRRSNPTPGSLMQGAEFRTNLIDAFKGVIGPEVDALNQIDNAAGLRDVPVKLDITTTNVAGTLQKFRDIWGEDLSAREFRARFRFRETDDFTPTLLGVAARSTASFPVAFEPSLADAGTEQLAGFDGPRWVIDGGLLDNAPIRAALDLIPEQPAPRQVRRYVCYLNPDPVEPSEHTLADKSPKLTKVLGHVVNLPRTANFVDHLRALQDASRAAALGRKAQLELLSLDLDALRQTAEALFGAYVSRRCLLSLEEILSHRQLAADVYAELTADVALPWIPSTPNPTQNTWGWGIRPAQRVLHLELDVLRLAIARSEPQQRTSLLAARATVEGALGGLDEARGALLADHVVIDALLAIRDKNAPDAAWLQRVAAVDQLVLDSLSTSFDGLFAVRDPLCERFGSTLCENLFGPQWQVQGDFDHFLERVLAVEVLRRAFSTDADIESTQSLWFAQLTPVVHSPLFATASRTEGWASAEEKLTGIKLGHFAAFYRRSWRANDFMWGRLDAAARVVDLLVDRERAVELYQEQDEAAWTVLADGLVPDACSTDRRWLVQEALVAHQVDGVSAPGNTPMESAVLRPTLEAALKRELSVGTTTLTREVCARLAQLEVAAHEIPVLVTETGEDARRGSATDPLDLQVDGAMRPVIESIREIDPSLPKQLGRDDDVELTSDLALGTAAHALTVGLSVVRAEKLPLARAIYVLRAALLPLSASVAMGWIQRAAAVAGFWAAALFLTRRELTFHDGFVELGMAWSKPTLAALVALLVVIGVGSAPGVRAWRAPKEAKAVPGLAVVALVLTSGMGAAGLAMWKADAELTQVLLAPGADNPHDWLLLVIIAALGGPVLMRPKLRGVVEGLLVHPRLLAGLLFVLVVLAIVVIVDSFGPVASHACNGGWKAVAAWAALAGAPLSASAYLFRRAFK